MLKKNLRKIGLLMIGFTLVTASVEAATITEPKNIRSRIEEREASQELMDKIEQQSRLDASVEEESQSGLRALSDQYYPYDYSLQYLDSMGAKGSSFTLSDGTFWIAKPSDGLKVQHWPDYSTQIQCGVDAAELYVTTNNNWFFDKDYKFRLVNRRNPQESVLVNLSQAPYIQYQIMLWNLFETGHVELVNYEGYSAVMKVRQSDWNILGHWNINDRIFIGRNTGWGSGNYPYLLINIDAAFTNVRASL